MSTDKFILSLAAELISSVNNNYTDNYDHSRFGEKETEIKKTSLKDSFISLINKGGYYSNFNNYLFSETIKNFDYPLTDFIYLYNLLEDSYSRDLLIKIVAYKLLGHKKVKLPLNTPEFWHNQDLIVKNQNMNDVYPIDFMDLKLPLSDLAFLGFPIKLYLTSLGINTDFIIKQYEFNRDGINISAESGETVIDGGGCYGDTALYFANEVGAAGRVHVFEFIPDNIILLNINIKMNPELFSRINLIQRPLWENSNKKLYYLSNGPGSRVSDEPFEGYTGVINTLSIDDYVEKNSIPKIDFIKLDIEGAEYNTLKGAVKTISRCKPKLAIALYHSTKDFDIIPRYLQELDLGYKFYLSHATIFGEETILFAKAY